MNHFAIFNRIRTQSRAVVLSTSFPLEGSFGWLQATLNFGISSTTAIGLRLFEYSRAKGCNKLIIEEKHYGKSNNE